MGKPRFKRDATWARYGDADIHLRTHLVDAHDMSMKVLQKMGLRELNRLHLQKFSECKFSPLMEVAKR